jgi:hypothetical protein
LFVGADNTGLLVLLEYLVNQWPLQETGRKEPDLNSICELYLKYSTKFTVRCDCLGYSPTSIPLPPQSLRLQLRHPAEQSQSIRDALKATSPGHPVGWPYKGLRGSGTAWQANGRSLSKNLYKTH